MRASYIWILSVIMAYSIGFALGGEIAYFIGFYYMVGSGIGYGIYRLIKRSKTKELKTTIQ